MGAKNRIHEPEAGAASHLAHDAKAAGAGVPVKHVKPAVGRDGELHVVQGPIQGHPVRGPRKQANCVWKDVISA